MPPKYVPYYGTYFSEADVGQRFKTVYFPSGREAQHQTVTLAFGARDSDLFEAVRDVTSLELRQLMSLPTWEDLQAAADTAGAGHSTFCLRQLRGLQLRRRAGTDQLSLWHAGEDGQPSRDSIEPLLATYRGGNGELFHSWFPYLEGYSPEFVRRILHQFAPTASVILDPFAGVGTTPLTAADKGLTAFYCEINPVLQYVTDAKATVLGLAPQARVELAGRLFHAAGRVEEEIHRAVPDRGLGAAYSATFGESRFFDSETYDLVRRARSWIDAVATQSPAVARYLTVAALAALVPSSKLVRRGDVRYRVGRELEAVVPFLTALKAAIGRISTDIELHSGDPTLVPPRLVLEDARHLGDASGIDADTVITSPPYLNGTNYFRNTKLELWFLRCLRTSADLARFRERAVTAGINDVSHAKGRADVSPRVTRLVAELSAGAYDRRIPRMVQAYFADMSAIVSGLTRSLVPGAVVAVDIGDSNYGGIHVPTDQILSEMFEASGAVPKHRIVLRPRQARSGPPLHQVLLIFENRGRKARSGGADSPPWLRRWSNFKIELPHQVGEHAKRNWGHPLHSLCSYGGKMKPALAAELVETFVPKGGVILDPFAGVGTIPFEASLRGRIGVGFEISPAAYHITRAKLQRPDVVAVEARIVDLENFMAADEPTADDLRSVAAIRFNGPLADYFEPRTLREIMLARRYFQQLVDPTPNDSFVLASLLHVLHGNRPYALSRRSHPITPFAPSGPATYRPLARHLRAKVERSLAVEYPDEFRNGAMHFQDATTWWPSAVDSLDAIVTSPPFFDSTRFYLANWMRLWFTGWEAEDFRTLPRQFVDERQKGGFGVYESVLRQARERLKTGGVVAMHLGMSRKSDMAAEIAEVAKPWFRVADVFVEDVRHLESHGIRDKGTVTGHAYLILE